MKNMFLTQAETAAVFAVVGSPLSLAVTSCVIVVITAAVLGLVFFKRR